MDNSSFNGSIVKANRIIYTASGFAKKNLLYLQEIGESQARQPHISARKNLASYLFFIVTQGSGTLEYRLPQNILPPLFREPMGIKMDPFLWFQYEQHL